jgi:hypothetical protein
LTNLTLHGCTIPESALKNFPIYSCSVKDACNFEASRLDKLCKIYGVNGWDNGELTECEIMSTTSTELYIVKDPI